MLASFTGAPFVISKKKTVSRMIQMANIMKGEKAVDIGSGNGVIVVEMAKKGAIAYGYELNPFLVLFGKLRLWKNGLSNGKIEQKNIWNQTYTEFDVITLYALPWAMKKLEKKLLRETKKGTRIVSNSFPFPNWKPTEKKDGVYLYTK